MTGRQPLAAPLLSMRVTSLTWLLLLVSSATLRRHHSALPHRSCTPLTQPHALNTNAPHWHRPLIDVLGRLLPSGDQRLSSSRHQCVDSLTGERWNLPSSWYNTLWVPDRFHSCEDQPPQTKLERLFLFLERNAQPASPSWFVSSFWTCELLPERSSCMNSLCPRGTATMRPRVGHDQRRL